MARYDIFISYRREGGYETALPIAEKLRAAGYRVFFDLESMNAGKFNEQLLSVIDGCKDFILVLPPRALERCSSPDDWVRREVEEALSRRKNIIPVMLRGFDWPSELPESMAELPMYQAVSASAPEYFDMSVKRLVSYLKSRPHRFVRKTLLPLAVVAIIVAVVGLACYLGLRWTATPFLKEVASYETYALGVIHEMGQANESFRQHWDEYIGQRQAVDVSRRERLDRDFIESIDAHYIPMVESAAAKFTAKFSDFSAYERWMLGMYDVDPQDISAIALLVAADEEEIVSNMKSVGQRVSDGFLNPTVVKSVNGSFEIGRASLNVSYYSFLAEMAKLPSRAVGSFEEIGNHWTLFPSGVPLNLPSKEYEAMAVRETNRMEQLINTFASSINATDIEVAALEERLDSLDGKISNRQPSVDEVEQRKKHIAQLGKDVEASAAKLDEAKKSVLEIYERIKEKDRLDPSDDQYLKWGKIVHFATFMGKVAADRPVQLAQGYESPLDIDDISGYLFGMLDSYVAAHPDAITYVPSVKAFYKDVANGLRPLSGLVVMGFQGGDQPVYVAGDIIVERNGHDRLFSSDDLTEACKDNRLGTVGLLRLEGGHLKKVETEMPVTSVLTGTLPLKNTI